MDQTGYDAIVDTDRDELRGRIEDMRRRFYQLALSADPCARCPGSAWNVQHIVAHVLSVAQRYRAVSETGDFRRARTLRELDQINQEEMEAQLAPVPILVDQLKALDPLMDALFDSLAKDYSVEFHFGIPVSGIVVQINWLLELVFHGEDIARAVGVPWEIRERDMLLMLREGAEVSPAYVRSDLDPAVGICVALQVPSGRPYVIHVHDGTAEMRARRPTDRPDAVLRAPASTMMRMLMGRIGPVTATRQGLRVVGGRRPWKVMKLQSCYETA
jgi:uncharacterized protein (TIGR03083 family)